MRFSKLPFFALLVFGLLSAVSASSAGCVRADFVATNFSKDQSLKVSQASQCLSYEPAIVNLTGQISRAAFTDANNKKEIVWLLNLENPVCVAGVAGDEININADNIMRMQLVLTADMYQKYKKLVGQRVEATGMLYHGHTAHHFTDVLLTVVEIK